MSERNLNAALSALPHGPEFRFLDALVSLTPGVEGEATYLVRADLQLLRGHFPGGPVLPGVLLVESLAQLAGVVAQSDPNQPPLRDLKLTAIRQAKILGAVIPGETVLVQVRLIGRMAGLIQAEGTARVGEMVVLRAEVVLSGNPGA